MTVAVARAAPRWSPTSPSPTMGLGLAAKETKKVWHGRAAAAGEAARRDTEATARRSRARRRPAMAARATASGGRRRRRRWVLICGKVRVLLAKVEPRWWASSRSRESKEESLMRGISYI
ncbi:hypothetical protein EE612_051951 [Oryza sativa]|nr:hypothetical protein EE612_051951 [Oryza sativa]